MIHTAPTATTDKPLRHSDGRRLGDAEYGTPAGQPVQFFDLLRNPMGKVQKNLPYM